MSRGLFIGAAGMAAFKVNLDVAAHNLANLNTPGFQRQQTAFTEVLAGAMAGVQATAGLDASAGPVQVTGGGLDLAVSGPGYFRLQGPDGEVYTRAGSFVTAADGTLQGPAGLALLGAAGPIRLPPGTVSLSVAADGMLQAHRPGATPTPVDQLALAIPTATATLAPLGANLWQAAGPVATAPPGEAGAGQVVAGALTAANVDMAAEVADLMRALRFFQFTGRAVQAADDITSAAIGMWRP